MSRARGRGPIVRRVAVAGLRARISLIAGLLFLPAAALRGVTHHHGQELTTRTAQQAALGLDGMDHARLTEETRGAVIALAEDIGERGTRVCRPFFATRLRCGDGYANFGAISPDRALVYSDLPMARSVNVLGRDHFQRAITSGTFTASEYQIGHIIGKSARHLGYPAGDAASQVAALVSASADPDRYSCTAAVAEIPPGSVIMAPDRQPTALCSPQPQAWIGRRVANVSLFAAFGAYAALLVFLPMTVASRLWGFRGGPVGTLVGLPPSALLLRLAGFSAPVFLVQGR